MADQPTPAGVTLSGDLIRHGIAENKIQQPNATTSVGTQELKPVDGGGVSFLSESVNTPKDAPPTPPAPDAMAGGGAPLPPAVPPAGGLEAAATGKPVTALGASAAVDAPLMTPASGASAPALAAVPVAAPAEAIASADEKRTAQIAQEQKKEAALEASGGAGTSKPVTAQVAQGVPSAVALGAGLAAVEAAPAAVAAASNPSAKPVAAAAVSGGSSAPAAAKMAATPVAALAIEASAAPAMGLKAPAASQEAAPAVRMAASPAQQNMAAPAPSPSAGANPAMAAQAAMQEEALRLDGVKQTIAAEAALKAPAQPVLAITNAPGIKVDLQAAAQAEKIPVAEARAQVKMPTPTPRRQQPSRGEPRNDQQPQRGRGLAVTPRTTSPSILPALTAPAPAPAPRRDITRPNAIAIIPAAALTPAASAGLFNVAAIKAPVPPTAIITNGLVPSLSTKMQPVAQATAAPGIAPVSSIVVPGLQPAARASAAVTLVAVPVQALRAQPAAAPVAMPTFDVRSLNMQPKAAANSAAPVAGARAAAAIKQGNDSMPRGPRAAAPRAARTSRNLGVALRMAPPGMAPVAKMPTPAMAPQFNINSVTPGRTRRPLATVMSATAVPANAPAMRATLTAAPAGPAAPVPAARLGSRNVAALRPAANIAKPQIQRVEREVVWGRQAEIARGLTAARPVTDSTPAHAKASQTISSPTIVAEQRRIARGEAPQPGKKRKTPGLSLGA